ncbi:MAG: type II secretion system minor pseudopilin GspJ [Proteobacteria bacterium]|nr:type II secretion system minor pseudopilin GspJ [Pseudomonadota bacterium]MCH7833651.1 type II secretion system minor pseudopilin GspJ [Pseudomonadota bacterium]
MNRRRSKGFTLIEVLVAVAIFGVLTTLSVMTISQTLLSVEFLSDRMDRLQAIQRTMRYLGGDLMQAAPRPVRDELGEGFLPAVWTDLGSIFALELTHGGWSNPAGLPRGTLQRSAYRLQDGELIRYHWTVLDRTYANKAIETVLLDDVESLLFRYLQDNGEWITQWPPLTVQGPASYRLRPRAVEIVLTLQDEGQIRRVLEVAP